MSRDQRITDNFGLQSAQEYALENKLPFAVVFTIIPGVKNRALEHFDFMLDGLHDIEQSLAKHNIPLITLFGHPKDVILNMIHHTKPQLVVVDFSPLAGVISWQQEVAKTTPVMVVDSHNVVPVWVASNKQEYSARTLRPKIYNHLNQYTQNAKPLQAHLYPWPGKVMPLSDLKNEIEKTRLKFLPNGTKNNYKSGESNALVYLDGFINERLLGYKDSRNNPTAEGLSGLSPYLHFGQIASNTVLKAATAAAEVSPSLKQDVETLIEELVVRKELADNFCYYNKHYKSLQGAPEWARRTIELHASDPREYVYSLDQFENAQTHDPAWNAAQMQLRKTGKMHGYMRMYWAKKVLEWSNTPEQALQILIYLNDFYSLDGGDPNGYVGILWSIAGVHDRPWGERPIFGTVRSMVYSGLKRKFAISEYENNWLS